MSGVPDVKGLPVINEEFEKKEPIVSEDRSVGSDFTFESFDGADAFSLECLEEDIFDDVRASIYRSCGTPIFSSASRDSAVGKASALSSKKVHASSQTQKTKDSSANLRRQLPTARKAKAMTVSSPHSQNLLQHIKGGYDSTPSVQSKRASSGYGGVNNRKTGEGLMMPQVSASVDSPGFKNFLTPPAKSSYRSPRSVTKSPSLARSSCDQFSSALSSKPLSSRGTGHSGTNSSKIASSGSISKPPLGYSRRSKLNNQTSSIHLLSKSLQLNNSPASSIDRWSSQSSSTFRATEKLKSGKFEGKLKGETNKATAAHHLTPTKMLPDQRFKEAPKEVSPLPEGTPKCFNTSGLQTPSPKQGFSDEVSKSLSSFGETPKSSKPSGLRMPSPRHGFFDEEKSMVRSTIEIMPFQLSSPDAWSDPSANALIRRNGPGNKKNIGSPLTRSLHCTPSTRPQNAIHSRGIDDISTPSTGMRHSMKTEERGNKMISKYKIGKKGEDQKAENGISLDTMKPPKKGEQTVDELLLESDHQLLGESKENFEDQVKNLNIYFEVIDVGRSAIETDGEKSNAGAQDGFVVDGEQFLRGQQQDSATITRIPFAEVPSSFDEVASTFPSSDSAKKENN
ncbi:uncharacterized protein LOC141686485 [Apium graveolens]|uniref:uncharacterized protein LOC141686485 n=1 Tax=Apium graveolens TaxID=4045 RepID=UPI003D7B31BF